jgi:hypothetical protein
MKKIKGRSQLTITALAGGVVSMLVNMDYADSLSKHLASKNVPFRGPSKAIFYQPMHTSVSEITVDGTVEEAEKWVNDWHPLRVIGKWKALPFQIGTPP